MKLSMRWLRDYLTMDEPTEQYIADMTMSGTKVEAVEYEDSGIENIVVGRVISIVKHPDADTLFICQVDVGEDEHLQIVTGADNVVEGSLVPVAKDGARLPSGTEIKKGTLRGEESFGMLCSLSELTLHASDFPYAAEDGIFLLEEECKPGDKITDAIGLNDTIVEFEITSNRPDCLAVLGIARETAATYGSKFEPPIPTVKGGGTPIGELISLTVENTELCPRYMAAAIEQVKIQPSPRWMRERLRASGVRPINNIVDITNFVMLEYGHPMHAFDLRHVAGEHIVVRSAKAGETITTLDGISRELSEEMLVIADEQDASAIAGVMGGEYSGIYPETKTIIFESAVFHGASVRKTSRKLGMRTESSGRFEKGLSSQNCKPALERACELVELLGAGIIAEGFLDSNPELPEAITIPLDVNWINGYIGTEIPENEMIAHLENLDFTVTNGKVSVPAHRGDVNFEVDLAEEVARMFGYNNIPTTQLRGAVRGIVTPEQHFRKRIGTTMVAAGYSEIKTYSFFGPKEYDKISLPEDSPQRDSIAIRNPLGEDTSIMRTNATASMMTVLSYNYNNRNLEGSLFEIATEYYKRAEGELPAEHKRIMLGIYGGGADFYTLKGGVEVLLRSLGAPRVSYQAVTDNPSFHPGRCAMLLVDGDECGIFGEVHPKVVQNYDMEGRAFVARLDYDLLFALCDPEPSYKPLPRFPASTRDLALVCAERTPVGEIERVLRESMGEILESVELFDVYRSEQLGAGKKSVAFALTLRAEDKTLTDKESDGVVSKSLEALGKIDVFIRE